MDDFQKMLEIVTRVERRIDHVVEKVDSLNKFRWRVEGMLFLSSGILSAIVAILVEFVHK